MARFLTLNVGAARAVLAEYTVSGKNAPVLTAYGDAALSADSGLGLSATLVPALHEIMRATGIKPGPAVVALSGQAVFPRFVKFPPGDPDKREQLVRYEVEQNVPFPIDEIIFDHQFLGETAAGDEAALIIAAKGEQVRQLTDAVASAGLSPRLVDTAPTALANIVKATYPGLTGCSVVLDIGSKTTNLLILEDEKVYNRAIPVAGNTITKEIVQTFGCSPEEAEALKVQRGYVAAGGVTADADETADRVSKIVRNAFTRLHAEISRSINFYRSQQGGEAPVRMFLTGGSARFPQILEFFTDALQIETTFLDPFGGAVEASPAVDAEALASDSFILAESAGLALRMQPGAAAIAVDLMPPELVARARLRKRIPYLYAAGACVLGAMGLYLAGVKNDTAVYVAKAERVNARVAALAALEARLKTAQTDAQAELVRSDAMAQRLAARSVNLRRVRDFRESLLPGMWIRQWEEILPKETAGKAAAQPGVKVTVRGWRDRIGKIESDWATANGGKRATAAEIVADALRKHAAYAPETVKIVSTKEVKDWLVEFVIQVNFAAPPTAVPADARTGKGKERK